MPIGAAAYRPRAATRASLGISAAWNLDARHAFLLGAQGTRLGAAAAHSPITETRRAPMGYVGLGWRL